MTHSTQGTTEALWQLRGQFAQLHLDGLKGTVDLSAPRFGLGKLCVFGRSLQGSVLGMQFDSSATPRAAPLAESYQRGSDLVASYAQTEERTFRPTLYWRAVPLERNLPAVAVDSIVSVQTSLLDTTPQLPSFSRMDATDMTCLTVSAIRDSVAAAGVLPEPTDANAEPCGCVVVPLPTIDATYCEMLHPSDWRGLETTHVDGAVEWAWSLVGHFMEKGVVRRLRVRGVFLQGPPDNALVRRLYAEFVDSPPPLTT